MKRKNREGIREIKTVSNEQKEEDAMLKSLQHVKELSQQYKIGEKDIMMMALNLCGVRSAFSHPRMRFNMKPAISDEIFYIIISLGREESPFFLGDKNVYFYSDPFASVDQLENDDCVTSYFRRNHTVLTLNSNARSQCVGCIFCPNSIETASDARYKVFDDLSTYVKSIAKKEGQDDASFIEKVTVCTGCFNTEKRALEHMQLVKDVFSAQGFKGSLHYIGSVIRSKEGFDYIARNLSPFELTLTVECFTNRDKVLRRSKASFMPEMMKETLQTAKDKGIEVNFTYIVGLDSYDKMIEELSSFAPLVTRFPLFNGYQPHNSFMQSFQAHGADKIDYYLKARQDIENIFYKTSLRPQSWECYRPLWYFSFADEELKGIRI